MYKMKYTYTSNYFPTVVKSAWFVDVGEKNYSVGFFLGTCNRAVKEVPGGVFRSGILGREVVQAVWYFI